jgi:hypothetical protein
MQTKHFQPTMERNPISMTLLETTKDYTWRKQDGGSRSSIEYKRGLQQFEIVKGIRGEDTAKRTDTKNHAYQLNKKTRVERRLEPIQTPYSKLQNAISPSQREWS